MAGWWRRGRQCGPACPPQAFRARRCRWPGARVWFQRGSSFATASPAGRRSGGRRRVTPAAIRFRAAARRVPARDVVGPARAGAAREIGGQCGQAHDGDGGLRRGTQREQAFSTISSRRGSGLPSCNRRDRALGFGQRILAVASHWRAAPVIRRRRLSARAASRRARAGRRHGGRGYSPMAVAIASARRSPCWRRWRGAGVPPRPG
jgi:hypothetical protein